MSRLSDSGLALGPVLERLGHEAVHLASLIDRAEAALHQVLDGLTDLPGSTASDLQRIDLVRQSLDDFARLLGAAATATPAGARLAPATLQAAVRLSGLAARLGGAVPVAPRPGPDTDDDLGLF